MFAPAFRLSLRLSLALLFTGAVGLSGALRAQVSAPAVPIIHINATATKPGSPLLYGLMTEEINYSYEGGLYAELIINRAFQHNGQNPAFWSLVKDAAASGTIALDRTEHLTAAIPVSLRINLTDASPTKRVGVANEGYWGIPIKPATSYRASFWAKTGNNFSGPVSLSLESENGATVLARAQVAGVSGEWKKYEAVLTTAAGVQPSLGRFVLLASSPGTLWLSQVSLFPPTWNDRPNGLRPDLMQLMAEMQPKFLRFPGGNYVEGSSPETRFDFKKMIGPISERPGHASSWGYRSEDGMGLLEFLTWCEDLKSEPVLAVFAGLFLNSTNIQAGPALQPYVQDALDEIEYVTGDVNTKWGAQRAKDGHPAPFKLTYVEIGNEDNLNNGTRTYDARFTQFYDALKAKYPALQLIATIPVTSRKPDLVDDHQYYNSGQITARQAATRYDTADRNGPKVIFGEYATRGAQPPTSDLGLALGDAAFLTGLERNSDHVIMSSYAPLFINVNPGASQWQTDLIGYDALHSFGSVSYYVQKMFSTHHGNTILATTIENTPTERLSPTGRSGNAQPTVVPALFASTTRDSTQGVIYLKVVNGLGTPQPVNIELTGVKIGAAGEAIVLSSGKLEDANSVAEPMKVAPKTEPATGFAAKFSRTFPAYSVTVLTLKAD